MPFSRLVPRPLSKPLIIGYCNWSQCDDKIVEAVRDGVNVVIWFSVNLVRDAETGLPKVEWRSAPSPDCVADVVQRIREIDPSVVHLMSIGGWNSPHPDTTNSVDAVFAELDRWNRVDMARPEMGFFGFDGWDWDIEGNDDVDSKYNEFTVECLDMMGKLAQVAKKAGYVFGMAPAESYLDPHLSLFDRSLKHDYPEWRELRPDFKYHGRNCYAYILSKYGKTSVDDQGVCIDTFDFVTVQLYEGYSHAEYSLNVLKADPAVYFTDLVAKFQAGWSVPFSHDPELNFADTIVSVPSTQLVLGLANGWAGDDKFLFVPSDQLAAVYSALREANLPIRGFAFWNIKDEGIPAKREPTIPVWLARDLREIIQK